MFYAVNFTFFIQKWQYEEQKASILPSKPSKHLDFWFQSA
jgi:hypothetical protein